MVVPPIPTNEEQRVAALHQYQILDTKPEPAFDGLTNLAAYICQTPIALISLIDSQRQWFKSKVGLNIPETPRRLSFCTYAILHSDLCLVPDTRQDQRFAQHPFVISDPYICFYGGVPLVTPDGYAIGTLCVVDTVPRDLTQQQQDALKTLAQQVVDQLELRRNVAALEQAALNQRHITNRLLSTSQAFEHAVEGISQLDARGCYIMVNPAYAAMVGYQPAEMIGMNWQQTVHPEDLPKVLAAYQQMLIQGKAEAEVRGIRKDKSIFFKQVVLVKACEEEQDLLLHYCFMKNITLRKQAEADLKLAYENLEQKVSERTIALSASNQALKQEIVRRKQHEQLLQQQAQQQQLISEIAQRIRQSLEFEELEATLKTIMEEVRQFLAVDRMFVYRFEADWSGIVIYESVGEPWISLQGRRLIDPCFARQYTEAYRQGRISVIDDISTAHLTECYAQFLSSLQAEANVVVPILQGTSLWGLLVVHQCYQARHWQDFEVDLLKQLSTQIAIAIQQATLYQQLTDANQELQKLVKLDGLTQVGNRRFFDESIEREWGRALREQTPLALIFCDIDFFKCYNDTYGHQQGDICLCKIAHALSSATERSADLVARYGGEEFVVVLPNTSLASANHVAERLQSVVQALHIPHRSSPIASHVTLSLGVASMVPQWTSTPSHLIVAADKALYQAKAEGRNRIQSSEI